MQKITGKLYVVGTPIGNLEDITRRAVRILGEVDFVVAEDTRRAAILLSHLKIQKPRMSCHKLNEAAQASRILERLCAGESAALVSDGGMPGVSDPGQRLIARCLEARVPIEVVPGPSAVLHALVASGFSATPFYFGGFLPPKSGARQRELALAAERACTSVYFESPHRLMRTLEDCCVILDERGLCVARELTKKFEQVLHGTAQDLLAHFGQHAPRGEITLVIETGKLG